MANILFFGKLKDELHCDQLHLKLPKVTRVEVVLYELVSNNPQWQHTLLAQQLMVAVDQVMGSFDSEVNDQSEIAFFPPVTGG